MFTDVLMEFLVFFASLFSKIASKSSLPTASNIAIVVTQKSESAVRFHMLYASMVWTRLDFELIIHIHEIVLTNHRKGHRQPGNTTLESQNPKIVENKKIPNKTCKTLQLGNKINYILRQRIIIFWWDPCCSSFQLSVVFCFLCLRPVSCVPNVANVFGLFILD